LVPRRPSVATARGGEEGEPDCGEPPRRDVPRRAANRAARASPLGGRGCIGRVGATTLRRAPARIAASGGMAGASPRLGGQRHAGRALDPGAVGGHQGEDRFLTAVGGGHGSSAGGGADEPAVVAIHQIGWTAAVTEAGVGASIAAGEHFEIHVGAVLELRSEQAPLGARLVGIAAVLVDPESRDFEPGARHEARRNGRCVQNGGGWRAGQGAFEHDDGDVVARSHAEGVDGRIGIVVGVHHRSRDREPRCRRRDGEIWLAGNDPNGPWRYRLPPAVVQAVRARNHDPLGHQGSGTEQLAIGIDDGHRRRTLAGIGRRAPDHGHGMVGPPTLERLIFVCVGDATASQRHGRPAERAEGPERARAAHVSPAAPCSAASRSPNRTRRSG
jgi:hypothetical protein